MYTQPDIALLLAACQRAGLDVKNINPNGYFAVLPSVSIVDRQRAAALIAAYGPSPTATVAALAALHNQYLTVTTQFLQLAGRTVPDGTHPKIEDADYDAVARDAMAADVALATRLSVGLLYLWQTIAATDPEGRAGAWERIAWHDPMPEVVANSAVPTAPPIAPAPAR